MSFERTSNGISNAHLFHSVDFVVYVEGKYEESNNDLVSYDQYFWRSIAETVSPDIKFKFISRGSKLALLPIANEIITGQISNTLVAFDRDYDFECENHFLHPRVIYTRGYSWENDVWNSSGIMHLVDELHLGEIISQDKADDMERCVSDFFRRARRVARINLAAKQNGLEYVVTSGHMRGLVVLEGNRLPQFNKNFFSGTVARFNAPRPILMLSPTRLTDDHVQGHLLAHFGYHFVCRAICLLGFKGKICINYLSTIAINAFKRQLLSCQDVRRLYYERCFFNAIQ